jgi:3-deoxy-manno-octulosonate cytidylyltransferase (CMP-KDO synthetase)
MRIVGVIPARYGSTRLPGKSLVPLCGKPLVQWVHERACAARSLSEVLVATDDERIRRVVEGFGGRVVMTRADHPSGTDRIAEAVAGLDAQVVVNIQGDEPLVEPALIDELGTTLAGEAGWDMATAAARIEDPADLANPAVVKVVWGREGCALYFSREPIPHVRDGRPAGAPSVHWRHIGLYAYQRTFLQRLVQEPPCELEQLEKLEQLRALHLGGRIKVVATAHRALGVDTPADVPLAEAALRQAGLA